MGFEVFNDGVLLFSMVQTIEFPIEHTSRVMNRINLTLCKGRKVDILTFSHFHLKWCHQHFFLCPQHFGKRLSIILNCYKLAKQIGKGQFTLGRFLPIPMLIDFENLNRYSNNILISILIPTFCF